MRRTLTVMLLGAVMTISALAQGPQQNLRVNALSARVAGPTDPKEVEAWMDQFLVEYLGHSDASLGFVLVRDDKILFQQGYGYVDEKQTPVVPDQTLFYAASVSKLVTATAVMQLVEQGMLKPDADVNNYLRRF